MGVWEIRRFVREEVIRQGFRKEPEQTERVEGMMMAWGYARGRLMGGVKYPTLVDITQMAIYIEPACNNGGWRKTGVRVGEWEAPSAEAVPRLMSKWFEALPTFAPDEAYKEFELIHPFADGNGRTGKVIHNWLAENLWDPKLVQDFFGHGVP